jgi:hypothetical protein
MQRSTKDAWLHGPGDLREEDVEDVPVPGASVRVRALPARFSAEVQSQLRLESEGREQVAKIDVAEMEVLQFAHGVIDPQFTIEEARAIQAKYGPAFRKVVGVIDDLSGVDKEAIEAVEQRFPASGAEQVDNGRGELGASVPAPTGPRAVDG